MFLQMFDVLPIDRILPVEILGSIFLEGTKFQDGINFLLLITHISRYWRYTALSMSTLWWDVRISLNSSHKPNMERSITWLGRSRNAPIRLWAKCCGAPDRSDLQPSGFTDQVNSLIVDHLWHCRSLIIDHRRNEAQQRCTIRNLGAIVTSIHSAPLLRDLSIYGSGLNEDEEPLLTRNRPWALPSLKRFRMRDEPLATLPLLSNLTSFQYRRDPIWDLEDGTPIGQPRLSVQGVLNLVMTSPNITHIDISDICADDSCAYSGKVITLSKLAWIDLNFRSNDALYRLLGCLSLPAIEHLSLDVDQENDDFSNSPLGLNNRVFPSLTSVRLSSLSPIAIISILQRSPSLQSCWVNDVDDLPYEGFGVSRVIDFLCGDKTNTNKIQAPWSSPTLPCPRITTFCMVGCEGLAANHLLRLADAYVPDCLASFPSAHSGRILDEISADLEEVEETDQRILRGKARVVNLFAEKWPDTDDDPFEFAAIPFHDA